MSIVERVATMRAFNRWWTRELGLLRPEFAKHFSLTEARILWELAHRDRPSANQLREALGIDRGQLSRILRRFRNRNFVREAASPDDARKKLLALTPSGRRTFSQIDAASTKAARDLLERIDESAQERAIGALAAAQTLLEEPRRPPRFSLREPLPGELGWVIARHGAIYAREYGWDARFEGLVAGVCAAFTEANDPARQRCWIAEADGAPVGSIFCTRKDARTAQLRLLLVEKHVRGLGIGGALIEECVRFAREAGYRSIVLWTNSVLVDARRLYERAGFRLTEEAPHDHFGKGLIGQTWELALAKARAR